jgi:hypothetical protein
MCRRKYPSYRSFYEKAYYIIHWASKADLSTMLFCVTSELLQQSGSKLKLPGVFGVMSVQCGVATLGIDTQHVSSEMSCGGPQIRSAAQQCRRPFLSRGQPCSSPRQAIHGMNKAPGHVRHVSRGKDPSELSGYKKVLHRPINLEGRFSPLSPFLTSLLYSYL